MREIKFRAWDGTRMYYFNNHEWCLNYNDISGWNVIKNLPVVELKNRKWDAGQSSDKPVFELMQFTGLKDKNGVDIYEGDIIQYKEYHVNKKWWSTTSEIPEIEKACQKQRDDFWINKRKVEFRDGCFVLGYGLTFQDINRGYKHEFGKSHNCDTEEKMWDFEILGNIHETPELLK